MHIYIAARYALKNEITKVALDLEAAGHTVISDWHQEKHATDVKVQELSEETNQRYAYKDLLQVRGADAMLFFAEHPDTPTVRGGRHVEFGIAIERGIPIFVVGHQENIFHYLNGGRVRHYDTVEEAIQGLTDLDISRSSMVG